MLGFATCPEALLRTTRLRACILVRYRSCFSRFRLIDGRLRGSRLVYDPHSNSPACITPAIGNVAGRVFEAIAISRGLWRHFRKLTYDHEMIVPKRHMRAWSRLIAFARHLQHAKMENDTSRHSGQFKWPQRRHFTLIRGQFRRFIIGLFCYRRVVNDPGVPFSRFKFPFRQVLRSVAEIILGHY